MLIILHNADSKLSCALFLSLQSSMVSGASPMHISHSRPLPPTAEEQIGEEPGYQLIPVPNDSGPSVPGPTIIYQVHTFGLNVHLILCLSYINLLNTTVFF